MTIRRTLLVTLLAFGVSIATLMTVLSYSRARAALSSEIRLNLETQALTLMQQVEAMLFERVKDVQGWRRLDLMQEVRVGDVDKRLARFLDDIKTAYAGVYTDLFCVENGRVVAASDAAAIGRPLTLPPAWLHFAVDGSVLGLSRPQRRAGGGVAFLVADLPDAFGDGSPGRLAAALNWNEVVGLLDRAVADSGRDALLLDAQGAVLAASAGAGDTPAWPLPAGLHGVTDQVGDDGARTLLGFARARAHRGLPDLGWTLLVRTPERSAFAAVHALLWTLVALLAVTALGAVVLALAISARGARPLQALAAYTRDIGQDIDTPARAIGGITEIRQLCDAFNRMVDDLRRSRAHLVRASKLAAVGEMAAKLAHEVRTPLGIIRSSAQLIRRQDRLDDTGREMMGFMVNECDRINALVTSLLESARPREPVFEREDVNAIVARVLELAQGRAGERQVELAFNAARGLPAVDADRDQLVQVLQNVVVNAIQQVGPGGHVRLTTTREDAMVRLDIEDDGPGIPAERREAVFEPFVSFRAGGIGLGLPVVREIVQAHGGTIGIDDSALGGARFRIHLPLARGD
ncbi:MAG: HAMP domain-containing protein [Gammaproteobacteria bacterium]|nr:HAMP domain-containing protein [Gammaproteobacteria bacterium]